MPLSRVVLVSAFVTGLAVTAVAGDSRIASADAGRGERLFTTHSCVRCHSINGKGGTAGPDLGKRIGRDYTPATLAAVMWNHAPAMWSAMQRENLPVKPLTRQEAADLFAYFYSVRFFDRPADAARGRRVYEEKRCAECHGAPGSAGAKPVTQWESMGDPIELAAAMWAHSANMRQAFTARGIRWPELTGQDISDILIYARNLPATRSKPVTFRTSGENGEALFKSKGCVGCHVGKLALGPRLQGRTLNDIAATMWSHAPKMGEHPPALSPAEMSSIVTWLWTEQVLEASGNASAGKRVFAEKRCTGCHGDASSGAPSLAGQKGSFSAVSMVSALWQHGPQMLDRMKQKGIEWPRFSAPQMSNLIAYLNSGQ
ncbi:MAG TPA: c-type cytochrome [Bryobacteraceae bacterium]|nr:c-type cytochrome [Bryobacteraceae bacterium]